MPFNEAPAATPHAWDDALLHGLTAAAERLLARNSPVDYLIAGSTAAAVFAALVAAKLILLRFLRRQGEDVAVSRRAILARAVARTWTAYLAILALWAGAAFVNLPAAMDQGLRMAAGLGFFLQLGAWAATLVTGFTERYAALHAETRPEAATGLSIIRLIARIAVWSVVALLILDNIGVNVTALVAGLGIGGIAIGLAAQNILGDLFASLAIVLDKPFVRGDFIALGPDHMGTVEKVGLKTTRIRALSGEQLVVANSDLLTTRIRNYKRMCERRVVLRIGVVYQTPHAKLARIPAILREAIEAEDGTRVDRSHFAGYGDWALLFEAVWYVQSADYVTYMDIQERVLLTIHRRFEEEGIAFAYPTQTIHLERAGDPEKPEPGERPGSGERPGAPEGTAPLAGTPRSHDGPAE